VAGFAGTVFVVPALKVWYVELPKPKWTPPGGIYAPVWTLLYASLGYTAAIVSASPSPARQQALAVFFAHMAINLCWAPIFFGARRVNFAAWWNVLLCAAGVANAQQFGAIAPLAGWIFVPYLVWCGFATVLNFAIARLN
ncbi:TspO/MBR-related protein, partial [Pavlovales sp. CCMP2436]